MLPGKQWLHQAEKEKINRWTIRGSTNTVQLSFGFPFSSFKNIGIILGFAVSVLPFVYTDVVSKV